MATRYTKGSGIQGGFDIQGVEAVRGLMRDVAPKEGRKLLRATILGIAGDVRDKARKNAKAVPEADLRDVARNIKSKRKKSRPERPKAVVFVQHGLGVKGDPWYWHFWEYGTKQRKSKGGRDLGKIPETSFMRDAREWGRKNFDYLAKKNFRKKLVKALIKASKKGKSDKFFR